MCQNVLFLFFYPGVNMGEMVMITVVKILEVILRMYSSDFIKLVPCSQCIIVIQAGNNKLRNELNKAKHQLKNKQKKLSLSK